MLACFKFSAVVFIFSQEHEPVIKRLNNEMKSHVQCLCKTSCDYYLQQTCNFSLFVQRAVDHLVLHRYWAALNI